MKSKSRRFMSFMFLVLILSASLAYSQTTEFTYQGSLKNGGVAANGNYDFEFALFDALAAGTQIGSTLTRTTVAVADGSFSVKLDFGSQFPGANRYLEIRVRQAGQPGFTTLEPRQLVNSAPYSVKAITADSAATATNATNATTATNATQLNGQTASFYQNATNISAGTLNSARLPVPLTLSGTNPTHIIRGENASTIDSSSGVYGASIAASGLTFGGRFDSGSTDGRGVFGLVNSLTGTTYGVMGQSLSTSGIGVFGWTSAASGSTTGVLGQSGSTSGRGVYGLSYAGSGTTSGVWGESNSGEGRGVYGISTAALAGIGVYGQTSGAGGVGVYGVAPATTSSVTTGVWGESASTDGRAVNGEATATTGFAYGGRFTSAGTSGTGVLGLASAGSGTTYGVYGQSNSPSGRGVYGLAGAGSGTTYGVYGYSNSPSGYGVYGIAGAFSGTTYGVYGLSNSPSGYGVYGLAGAGSGTTYGVWGQSDSPSGYGGFFTSPGVGLQAQSTGNDAMYATTNVASRSGLYAFHSATTGTNYGVFGRSDSGAGYGLWAQGNSGASGTKSFRIDHPDDPENKYLLHFASESPEVINFYSGKVILNNEGEAVVELPAYFAKVNKDPRYQLTAVGTPMPMLYVADEIDEAALSAGAKAGPNEAAPKCTFRIAGGAPGGKVSWRVEAVRNDLWVRTNGAAVEVEKQGREKGTYQHPELYGQPKEKGMNYDATLERKEAERKEQPEPPRRP